MIRQRGPVPIFLLLLLLPHFVVLFGGVARIFGGAAAVPSTAVATPQAATPTPTPIPSAGPARAVVRSLAAVQQAFNAGDVRLLCRSGALVDPEVISLQDTESGGCESELETLIANQPPLRLAVQKVALRRDLATASVNTASSAGVPVDLVRHGRRWLLSFSDGGDPMPALAGTA